MTNRKDAMKFMEVMKRNFSAITSEQAEALLRIAARVHTLAEQYRNGRIDSDEWEKRSGKCEAQIHGILDPLGATFRVNGDPRGYAVYIQMLDGSSNSFGGRANGYGI